MRVRFAPSPTGALHIGGLRTALVNCLCAARHGGELVLRLEDTDRRRLVPGAGEQLYRTLLRVGIEPHESPMQGGPFGPYEQSQRLPLYNERAEELLQSGAAYRCFCTSDRLDLLRREALRRRLPPKYDNRCRAVSAGESGGRARDGQPHVLRFKMHERIGRFDDLVYGTVSESSSPGDPVIVKSDGYPTYHFANVCDDHAMRITHVIRGAEWLVSTVKHVQLYESFGWQPPQFAHLPLLVDSRGRKLSKRMGDVDVLTLLRRGYLPSAVLNLVSRMGAGLPPTDKVEVRSLSHMRDAFDMSLIGRTPIVVDGDYLRHCSVAAMRAASFDYDVWPVLQRILLRTLHVQYDDKQYARRMWRYLQRDKRIERVGDVCDSRMLWLWRAPDLHNMAHMRRALLRGAGDARHTDTLPVARELVSRFAHSLSGLNVHSETYGAHLLRQVKGVATELNIKYGKSMQFLRYCLMGDKTGPPLREITSVIGKEVSLQRLHCALQLLADDCARGPAAATGTTAPA